MKSENTALDLNKFNQVSKNRAAENKKFLRRLKSKDARKVDDAFHQTHEKVFEGGLIKPITAPGSISP